MPSRAYTSFLHGFNRKGSDSVVPVSMPSRAYTSFLHVGDDGFKYLELDPSVNALSGLYLISTKPYLAPDWVGTDGVNALSGLYLISTDTMFRIVFTTITMCQCPLGLIPHFYRRDRYTEESKGIDQCQCPLGLIPHFYGTPSKT